MPGDQISKDNRLTSKYNGLKRAIKPFIPLQLRRALRQIASFSFGDYYLARAIDRLTTNQNLKVALYDRSVDALKFPSSGTEILEALREGVIADAAAWLRKVDSWVPAGGTIFDVGAYRGVTAQWFARKASFVYAFEPLPENITSINDALHARRIENVEIIDAAISNKVGNSDFYVCQVKGHNSLGPVKTSQIIDRVQVNTTTLDAFCRARKIHNIDFMKIDVEGFEYEVLEGASGLLRDRKIGTILFEISRVPLESLGKSAGAIYELLLNHKYKVFDFDGNEVGKDRLQSCEFDDFLSRPIP